MTSRIKVLELERENLLKRIQEIDKEIADIKRSSTAVNMYSSVEDKIKLFQSLFQGRSDVYAKRFESSKTGKSGYQPA